jgi:hypothetical protein
MMTKFQITVNNIKNNFEQRQVDEMKRIIILLIILSLGLMAGCQSNPTNPNPNNNAPPVVPQPDPPAAYFPLTLGSYWEYEGHGNEYATFNRKVLFVKGNRAQTTEDNGGTVSTRVIETTENSVKILYFSGEDYEPKNLLDTNFPINSNSMILQAPIKVGTAWPGDGDNKQIVAVDAVVETPAGKFENCVQVKLTNPNSTIYQYFKKGIGMVKQEFISAESNTTVTSTLKKYEIK